MLALYGQVGLLPPLPRKGSVQKWPGLSHKYLNEQKICKEEKDILPASLSCDATFPARTTRIASLFDLRCAWFPMGSCNIYLWLMSCHTIGWLILWKSFIKLQNHIADIKEIRTFLSDLHCIIFRFLPCCQGKITYAVSNSYLKK